MLTTGGEGLIRITQTANNNYFAITSTGVTVQSSDYRTYLYDNRLRIGPTDDSNYLSIDLDPLIDWNKYIKNTYI